VEPLYSGDIDIAIGNSLKWFRWDPSNDAFGRLRVSDPVCLFDSTLEYDLQPSQWETILTGNAVCSHIAGKTAALMMVELIGDKAVRQTRRYLRYQPGRSHLVETTFAEAEITEGVRSRVGYFDDANGIYLQIDEDGPALVLRSSTSGEVVERVVRQSEWSYDRLDGTDETGVTLDVTKAQILVIDLQFLGVGRIRVGFNIGGGLIWAHAFNNANIIDGVYMQSGTLPVRYEIEAVDALQVPAKIHQICATVISEGGTSTASGTYRSVGNGTTLVTVTTRRAVLTIRPKLEFAGVANRGLVAPTALEMNVVSASDRTVYWELVKGGTLGGTPSWTSVSDASGVEYDVAATTVTGGQVIKAGYDRPASGGVGIDLDRLGLSDIPLTVNAAGDAAETLSVVCTASASVDIGAALQWFEAR
jgi:hypothetical protein